MDYLQLQQQVANSIAKDNFDDWLTCIPALTALITTPQDPLHHGEGNVWIHTQMVLRALIEQTEFAKATEEQQFVSFMTALLHDIAKPETTVIDEVTGKISQPRHSQKGEIRSRVLLWQMAVPFELREQICRIIAVHQVPFFALSDTHQRYSPQYLVHRLSWQLPVWMLCLQAKADMLGRICADKARTLDEVELFKQLALEEECLYQPRQFVDDHTRVHYFRGSNVLPDYALYPQQGSKVILMSGLPASGKNSWVSKHYPTWPVASYDDARSELKLKHGENEGLVIQFVLAKVKQWLRDKQPFIWNATHLSQDMRQKALDLLYAYHAEVEIVYIEQPEQELYRRNLKRDTSLANKKIQRMFSKWQVPLPTEAHQVSYVINQ
ncbi:MULTISPECIES: AAA family ATPase [unclassified Gilliamella]|uniref:AAA family ATPase n=1 Tax=unclassified Gilliamella TaxID=2685620 RepID=UPI002269AB16|nr:MULTISPECIES: AAA family ATPase [unclassified Gilliamella]MCX8641438.1 AAA family ATPase [Gilliamella sp. B3835]MCX8707548.1 AAA family ATPase [Gilliamella sp. B3783]MCX8710628.1 AAA family ATPase [Gilliamella sp. B3780]MCX8714743.1 AAA family ATPase [Gilliamella sp. B3781]MCX8716445.1 AAA family ATPase [Gilliamella sp. B3784]